MLRMMGAALLMAGTAALGSGAARQLRKRTETLRDLVWALEEMQRELSFSLTPMPELFCCLSRQNGEVGAFFLRCGQLLDEQAGSTVQQAWEQAADECLIWLNQRDRQQLVQLGAVLGRYGGEEQVQAISGTAAQLREHMRQSGEEQTRQGKVYTALGVTGGMFLVIMLL